MRHFSERVRVTRCAGIPHAGLCEGGLFRRGQPRNDEEAEGGLNMCEVPLDVV